MERQVRPAVGTGPAVVTLVARTVVVVVAGPAMVAVVAGLPGGSSKSVAPPQAPAPIASTSTSTSTTPLGEPWSSMS